MNKPIRPFTVSHADVWRIAIPASIALITEPLVGITDITVIGRLGETGLLGGVVVGSVAFEALLSVFFFLRLSTAGLVAQAEGAEDAPASAAQAMRAFILAVLFGIACIALTVPLKSAGVTLFSVDGAVRAPFETYFGIRMLSTPFVFLNFALLGWLYGRGAARTSLVLTVVANLGNVGLSVALVYGAGMGVEGVAFGTLGAQIVASFTGLALVWHHFKGWRAFARIVPFDLLVARDALKALYSLSAGLTIRSVVLMAVFAYFTAAGSRAGDAVLAANAVLLNFMMVTAFFLDGMATASERLCGKAVGARYRPAYRAAVTKAMTGGFVLAGGLSLLFLVAGGWLVDLMTTAPEVRATAREFLVLAAIAPVTGVAAFVFDGVAAGATMGREIRNGMLICSAAFFALSVPLQALWDVHGLWVALNLFFVLRGVVFYWLLKRREPDLFPPDPGTQTASATA